MILNCQHCGETCADDLIHYLDYAFCCAGCKTVYQILQENDLQQYYELEETPGLSFSQIKSNDYSYLDEATISERLLSFKNETHARIQLKLPQIHCLSCVWLLENLHRLNPAVELSEVNFSKFTADILFRHQDFSLRQLIELLASLGYAPDLNLADLDKQAVATQSKDPLIRRLAVAGFCFGNIMLFSFPTYLGLENDQKYFSTFSVLSALLSLPVVFYCSKDYFTAAKIFLQKRIVTLDLPIFIGILALFFQSFYLLLSQTGEGYWDSLSGLIFFLLLGRLFQKKSYESLSFDRDYKSFFPVWASVLRDGVEQSLAIDEVEVDDRLIIRNGELIPADALLLEEKSSIDYSFVTGESLPCEVKKDETIYAGARLLGQSIKVKVLKTPSRSYLTSLWNSPQFRKDFSKGISPLTDRVGLYFTIAVISLSLISGVTWFFLDTSQAINTSVAVLIVACPCALALSAPFSFGFATRLLGGQGLYLKSAEIIEKMAQSTDLVFDKTGTLTDRKISQVNFDGQLTQYEMSFVKATCAQSTHPLSQQITQFFDTEKELKIDSFEELPGKGIQAFSGKVSLQLGKAEWLGQELGGQSEAVLKINEKVKGRFTFSNIYRPGMNQLFSQLEDYDSHLLSGDVESEEKALQEFMGTDTPLHFHQTPEDKMNYVQELQDKEKYCLMVGDGLNDSGALKAANCGFSVAEELNAFYPACDGIFQADALKNLQQILGFSKSVMKIIKVSFSISLLYNVIGLYFAITGQLSPVFCAVLMPLSSLSILAITAIGSKLAAHHHFKNQEA